MNGDWTRWPSFKIITLVLPSRRDAYVTQRIIIVFLDCCDRIYRGLKYIHHGPRKQIADKTTKQIYGERLGENNGFDPAAPLFCWMSRLERKFCTPYFIRGNHWRYVDTMGEKQMERVIFMHIVFVPCFTSFFQDKVFSLLGKLRNRSVKSSL